MKEWQIEIDKDGEVLEGIYFLVEIFKNKINLMSTLLDITGEDILLLSDADLRSLIGRLCEADYLLAGLPIKNITWGGNQDATDGGLDVVIRDEITPPSNSFVPRSKTAFQVKKPDMSKSKILAEMKPHGILRDEIKSLVQEGGAYILVSSGSSTSEKALINRKNAMREAVSTEVNHLNLYLDFYDRGRVATWVRSHPSMILWVRNKIGHPLKGWYTYDNWAKSPGGIKEEYLLDDSIRLKDRYENNDYEIPTKDGLLRFRSLLRQSGISLRLVGLSGVGKTRFIQALFDERIVDNALDPNSVFYTDISDNPDPDPGSMAEQLIANRTKGILIVDNCSPDLHRRLTKICTNSTISLLTVEYDIGDDLPEETKVFRLEPSSIELIEKLIKLRFPHVSQVDAHTIANFSGGNARVAIALSNTVRLGESLSDFRDEELFKRLFWQRQSSDKSLLISAEVCSLVYSFEGADVDSVKSELKILASIINKSINELFRDIRTLNERDLIQSRGVWRAILPQAIANRLAKHALEAIPNSVIIEILFHSGSQRLIKSFAHRLSFLHDCDVAITIVNGWLSLGGWLDVKKCNFNEFEFQVFKYIAPVAPEKTLGAIERAVEEAGENIFSRRDNEYLYELVKLLRQLAYDPELFTRSVRLLCQFALLEKAEKRHNSIRDVIKSLFRIKLSGTHAPAAVRAGVIKELIDSSIQEKCELGVELLNEALEAHYFVSMYEFDFGSRLRDFGFRPKTRSDEIHWFEIYLDLVTQIAISDKCIAEQARKIFAKKMRGLWSIVGLFGPIENSVLQIKEKHSWNEGWIAVKGIIRYDGKRFSKEILERLNNVEKLLRPIVLIDQVRLLALSDQPHSFDFEDESSSELSPSEKVRKAEEKTYELGIQVARDYDTLNALLPELVTSDNNRLHYLGRGLANGCKNKNEIWRILYSQIEKTLPEKRKISVILGFLNACAKSDPSFYNEVLDNSIEDIVLGEWFPILQRTSLINKYAIERFHRALDSGKADINTFKQLAYSQIDDSIREDDLMGLLERLLSKVGGIDVVLRILSMWLPEPNEDSTELSEALVIIGRKMLAMYPFFDEYLAGNNQDYDLAKISRACLKNEKGITATKELCIRIKEAIRDSRIEPYNYSLLINELAQIQPIIFLDIFLTNIILEDENTKVDFSYKNIFSNGIALDNNPFNQISDENIISWCEQDPVNRYPAIACAMQPYWELDNENKLIWKPLIYLLIEKAIDLNVILTFLSGGIEPTSCSGSYAEILERRLFLFESMFNHNKEEVREWAKNQHTILLETIRKERENEGLWYQSRNNSFE
ncbi:MAG: hypothetical protein HF310_16225 [Ignavibacteria bacterium]|nr:hypothetical protein [Ignavibacteria bacterium]